MALTRNNETTASIIADSLGAEGVIDIDMIFDEKEGIITSLK